MFSSQLIMNNILNETIKIKRKDINEINCDYLISKDGVKINISQLRRLIKQEIEQRKLKMKITN